MKSSPSFISAGGNRHPYAADWDTTGSDILAFGADRNVALWRPTSNKHKGVFALLKGHRASVNAVKFLYISSTTPTSTLLLTAGSDGSIILWRSTNAQDFVIAAQVNDGEKTINAIEVLPETSLFVTAAATSELKVWKVDLSSDTINLVQTLSVPGRFFPLAVSLSKLPFSDSIILAAAGTKSTIQLFVSDSSGANFVPTASLTGHEGWIRALSFAQDPQSKTNDLLLASASQDKYIRLWRLCKGDSSIEGGQVGLGDSLLDSLSGPLSNKLYKFSATSESYSVTFEALLLGHEDWVFTARWFQSAKQLTLLSASADNSLAIWNLDESSGVWTCSVRLGELISQKGATTATGSTGGFWIGMWSPDGSSVVSLGRTGSWRLWGHDTSSGDWNQQIAVSGHTRDVRDVAWSPDGSYLVSTSSDQTTRLFAQWSQGERSSWHEFSRPQIHGYDLNCVALLDSTRLVTGADEKLMRVFNQPKIVYNQLRRLCGLSIDDDQTLSDAANIPVLGLSNKAVIAKEDAADGADQEEDAAAIQAAEMTKEASLAERPPLEDQLSRYLLWPEMEKLYGHGYEISAVASSHDGKLIASACRATSINHAVIRLFTTQDWREMKPPLSAHSLTVTSLRFSPDDRYLLSVGRDRQLAIFHHEKEGSDTWTLAFSNPKAHTRMILDCAWAPQTRDVDYIFATAARDKTVALWTFATKGEAKKVLSIAQPEPITAIAFLPILVQDSMVLAIGLESGFVQITCISASFEVVSAFDLPIDLSPAAQVNRLAWRPVVSEDGVCQLAIAAQDSSLRVVDVSV